MHLGEGVQKRVGAQKYEFLKIFILKHTYINRIFK